MFRRIVVLSAALMLFVAAAYAAVDTNVRVPIAQQVFVPCANGGAGEVLALSGNLHILIAVTVNPNSLAVIQHFQPTGVIGVGDVTGDTYRATGITRTSFRVDAENLVFPQTFTSVNNFRMIGPGPGNNLLIHETFHVTIDANGTVTVEADNLKAECK